ncbi:acid-sensing ion channel 3 [Nephila pilipes]|uniref:Acid-sensing ion channel 3 n=1 Tax=Nephila pilipes TaxID=299642 RepID=A0A8X6Q969_NEPPI|nr:acid-sensing ion channel 3 [Nephila pilipes]
MEQVKRFKFPAVSICNFNRMKKFGLSSGTPLLLSEGSSSFYCNAANDSERDEIKDSLQQYYEMDEEWRWRKGHKPSRFIQKCLFRGRICPQNRLSYFQNLSYGNCITFNKRNEKMEALTVSDVGPNTGLILDLKLESVT